MKDINGNDVPGIMVPVIDTVTLPVLGKMYSKLESYTVREDTPVEDIHNTKGWVKLYASIDAPNRNTFKSIAEEFAKQRGYLGQRLITYILAAQASKDFADHYLDEEFIRSWLLGSRAHGGVLKVGFSSGGCLLAGWSLHPRPPRQGAWRFEEVKRV